MSAATAGPRPGGGVLLIRRAAYEGLLQRGDPGRLGPTAAEAAELERRRRQAQALAQEACFRRCLPQEVTDEVQRRQKRAVAGAARTHREYETALQEARDSRAVALAEVRRALQLRGLDGVRSLHSGLRLSETLRERQAQLVFRGQLAELEARREAEWAARDRADFESWEREEAERRSRQQLGRQRYRQQLLEQLEERNEIKKQELMKKQKEREEWMTMAREKEETDAHEKQLRMKKKAECKEAIEQGLEANRQKQIEKMRDDMEEDQIVGVITSTKRRINKTRKEKEKEEREEKIKKYLRAGTKIWEANAAQQKALDEVDQKIRAQQEQMEREADAREAAEREKAMRGAAEVRRQQSEWLEQEQQRRGREAALRQWQTTLRFKQTEQLDRLNSGDRELLRRKREEARRGLDQQMEERAELQQKERAETIQAVQRAKDLWAEHDAYFLEYAQRLIAESRCKGRSALPLERVVEVYKKQHSIPVTTDPPMPLKAPPFIIKENSTVISPNFYAQ